MNNQMETTLRIGKSGINDYTVKHAKELLRKMKVIKVKFLPSAITKDKKELMEELAEKTNSKIKHKVGFIVVLEKLK